jgi:hypothetical protein
VGLAGSEEIEAAHLAEADVTNTASGGEGRTCNPAGEWHDRPRSRKRIAVNKAAGGCALTGLTMAGEAQLGAVT